MVGHIQDFVAVAVLPRHDEKLLWFGISRVTFRWIRVSLDQACRSSPTVLRFDPDCLARGKSAVKNFPYGPRIMIFRKPCSSHTRYSMRN